MQLANFIDHTLLKPTASLFDIKKLCKEAITHQFYAVCVNPCHVVLSKKELANINIKIAAVVGFPLGANTTEVKLNEAIECITNGADEIDMVINIGWLKTAKYIEVEQEISQVKRAIGTKLLKVIIECCYLSQEEIKIACQLAINAKANYVKTSTGYGTGGASLEDVRLMKEVVGNQIKIKASGGIKDRITAQNFIELGVSRIGTSSGIDIITTLN